MQGKGTKIVQRVVGSLLILALGGAFVWMINQQTVTQAGPPPFSPNIAAAHDKDKLMLSVAVPQRGDPKPGTLKVSVVDADGNTLASEQQVLEAEQLQSRTFAFKLSQEQAKNTQVVVDFQGQRKQTDLKEVLLAKGHETTLAVGRDFYAGTHGALTCKVDGILSLTKSVPLPGSEVEIQLVEKDGTRHKLYAGKTAAQGKAQAEFDMPELPEGEYTLEVQTKSPFGEEKLTSPVTLKSGAKILLISDKPIYQPGQLMHIRAMVLRPFDMKPVANREMLFEVEDPKGNKVFKRTLKTSEFGIASVDFQLASEVNMGAYHLRAAIGQYKADKTVNVKRYVLPKFKVAVDADKKFYLPKETIRGSIQSDYFFGKPVAKAKIEVTASTFDVQFRKFQTWEGNTDAQGHAKFEIQLPDYFVGQPLQNGKAMVKLDVKLVDSADHKETVVKTYAVSDRPIEISLIAEGGKLVPGLENRVFAAAVYPDGSPAPGCDISLYRGKSANKNAKLIAKVTTNEAGLAEFKVTPEEKEFRQGGFGQPGFDVPVRRFPGGLQQMPQGPQVIFDVHYQAKDNKGNRVAADEELNSQPLGENVLLRLDKAIYQPGDSMDIDVRTSAGLPTVYIDVVRGGQILLSRWYDVVKGQASQKIDLPPSMFGSLEVHAYQMLASGEIIRDSRVVYVQPATGLNIDVQANKDEYLPGQGGSIRFKVTDKEGNPTQAALGVIIVDEAVYALQDLQPGLEKVYFTLQEELLKPKVQIKYSETVDNIIRQPIIPAPRQLIAEVLLTSVELPAPRRWEVNPAIERKQQFQAQVMQIRSNLFHGSLSNNLNAIEFDKQASEWKFRDGLLEEMVKKNMLPEQFLKGPFGNKLTMKDLSELEETMTPNNLAKAVTEQHMNNVGWAIVHYGNQHRNAMFKNGVWSFPESIMDDLVKQRRTNENFTRDGWGNRFRMLNRPQQAKKTTNTPFGAHFATYHLVSAGPDQKFGTKDDISTDDLQQLHQLGQYAHRWWGNFGDGNPFELQRQMLRRGVAMPMDNLMARPEAAFGGAVPQAAPGAVPAPVAHTAIMEKTATDPAQTGGGSGGGSAPITRVREYFPETMLWQPGLITDEKGEASLALDFADSITTWRLSASANSRAGALGGVNVPLKVFQEFFVDIDVPVNLTQGDEVAFPVAVYNYLKTPQTVRIELQKEGWFELLDQGDKAHVRSLELKPNEVTSVSFRVRAGKIGNQPLTVKAYGSKRSDAVKRIIEVVPNGQKQETVITDRLKGKVSHQVAVADNALPDASKLFVRIYPGVMAQVVEGLDGMLRMPNGCFEQTSSSAYPNILIVDYLRKNRISSPELMMKSEQYLNVGYQRLLTFERPGGGFDWWGRDNPLIWLSAYGLQEFNDMARVYPIDRGIIDRTQGFLVRSMDKDGTWSNIGATHGETIANMGNAKLLLTSYVTWSLLESGYPKQNLKKSIDYIRGNLGESGDNAYILALAANALASYDAKDDSTLEALQRLDKLRKELPEMKACCFPLKGTSLAYSRGNSADVETTALAALAMTRTGQFTTSVNQALAYLVQSKQGNGTWGSTQATILALKALMAGMEAPKIEGNIPFTVLVNGKEAARGNVNNDNADVMQAFDLSALINTVTLRGKGDGNQGTVLPRANGDNITVEIRTEGDTGLMYQILSRSFTPWPNEVKPTKEPVIQVDVTYDRTKLSTNDILKAKATLRYNGDIPTYMVMLDLGIAPGFNVDPGDFAELVDQGRVKKFSITQRQVILYLGDVKPGDVLTFDYTLRPRFPLRARTAPSVAYEYNTPRNRAESAPVELTVVDKE